MHAVQTGGGVTHRARHIVPLIADADMSANSVPITSRALKLQLDPVIRAWANVVPKFRGFAERGDDNINTSVAIEVGKRGTTMSLAFNETGTRRYIGERAVA